jgi:hypothetical protein
LHYDQWLRRRDRSKPGQLDQICRIAHGTGDF